MIKIIEKFTIFIINVFCLLVAIELCVNYCAFHFLFPIKNATSYGYIERKTNKTVIPLNKYSSRIASQIALPFELVTTLLSDKELKKSYNDYVKKYGYIDKHNKVAIDYRFETAGEFKSEYAVVGIKQDGVIKYGTIDKHGRWIIEPKYEYLCPFDRYYTRACIDKKHCGVIDRFGSEITLMTYKTDKLKCDRNGYSKDFCSIGENRNNIHCNYFL